MADGQITYFDEGILAINGGVHDFDSDLFKVAWVNVLPVAGAVSPTLASHSECTAGGNYAAGGFTMTAAALANAAGVTTHDFTSDILMVKHASNPADVVAGLVYNTSKSNQAIGWVEVKAAGADGTAGAIAVNWNALGVHTATQV
tara:strand:- start:638 stop:1072 length:435 start_codon:yes stop_codon:yes gene_type:complete